jgi:hypothetical protein
MNGKSSNLITWTVEGTESEGGHVRADDFLDKIDHLLSALNGIDKVVSQSTQPTLYYRIVKLSYSSPLSFTIEPVIKSRVIQPSRDYVTVRHHRFFKELDAIHKNEPVSPDIDEPLLEDFRDLAAGRGELFRVASISNSEATVQIDEVFEKNVTKMLGEEYASYGGVEGKLDALNIHGRTRRVWIYPTIGPQRIRCDFLPGTKQQLIEAAGHYIRVEGYKYFRPHSPYPVRVKVMDFEMLDTDEEPVLLSSLRGIAPDATGEMNSVDFVRAIRDEWD